jgi:UDP-N-acetylmuramoyl-tripeptide--D-alanyl-D-alanine ligase
MAVIEMGANHQKEIESYCRYAQPTHGVITNCGKAHLEGFGGVEGVRKGKGELYDYLRAHNGTAFIYTEYDYLKEMSTGIQHIVSYGIAEGMIKGKILSNDPFIEVAITVGLLQPSSLQTQLVGDYNLPNILCAVVIGKYFNVPEEKIKSAIENYTPSNSRSQLVQKETNNIILDAYNANPTSMKAAIENFAGLQASKKVLMLGGMMELGAESLEEHISIIDLIRKYNWAEVVLVGGDFGRINHGFAFFANATEAKEWFARQGFMDTHLLIKGSRSMQMEKILE